MSNDDPMYEVPLSVLKQGTANAAALSRIRQLEPETVARWFHEAYEQLAPDFGYKTREASAVPWEDVPEANRRLMVATAEAVLGKVRL